MKAIVMQMHCENESLQYFDLEFDVCSIKLDFFLLYSNHSFAHSIYFYTESQRSCKRVIYIFLYAILSTSLSLMYR